MASAVRLAAIVCLSAATWVAAQTPRLRAFGAPARQATQARQAGQAALTIDAIYDPERRVDFTGSPATNLRWIDDTSYLQARRSGRGLERLRVDAVSGGTSLVFDPSRMEAALAGLPGIAREDASAAARSANLPLSPSYSSALARLGDDLYVYDFRSDSAVRLTTTEGTEEEPTFSPDGTHVAFVRGNNLHVVDITSKEEAVLTTDGGAQILNGKLDWLYQEEIYGRGRFGAYWWSPDSARLAFLQLDERPVPEFTVVDDIPYRPDVEVTDYPKAGDPNPGVRLGIAPVRGGAPLWVNLAAYDGLEILIADVDWLPDGTDVAFQVQDREQTWLDLNLANAYSGQAHRILRETTPAWVNANGSPTWLDEESFLWLSERSGFKHLYQYRRDGRLMRQVTSGPWEIRRLYGVDRKRGVVYFDAGVRRHVDTDIYSVALNGSTPTRLSRTDGTHRATFNPAFTQYIDVWSDAVTPPQVRVHATDGSPVRVIDANPVPPLAEYRLSTPEFIEVKARDGFVMDAMMIKPPDFDAKRRYPVYQITYAGPANASVRNEWGGSTYLYHQLLAQHGVIVWALDNRSASGKGAESQWPVYQKLGEGELRDLEDGIAWLKRQPYVDGSRIALHGWSYGGFMTAYALTHSTSWAAGIAVAPVTDWRNYDTIYTERYMKTPQHNPDGYRRTAPRFAASNLHGRLLLIHGTIDDNVHWQNSQQFAYELQRAGKAFEIMIYPRSRHGISDPRLTKHLRQTMFDFVMRTVGNTRPAAASASQ